MHGGTHSGGSKQWTKAFAIGAGLNLAFVVAEAFFGFRANSIALLADAGHNFGDVISLGAAWGATVLSRRPPTTQYTYGFGSSSILAALGNAVLLLIASGALILSAAGRLIDPEPVSSITVMFVAAAGIAVNGISAMLFRRGRESDLNIRAAFLHLAADAAIAAGVLLAGAVIYFTGWLRVDAVVSLVIAAIIVWAAWGLLRESVRLAMQGVPTGVDPGDVRARLAALSEVVNVHDLHIWPLSTTETALTCHLVMRKGRRGDDAFLEKTAQDLHEQFGIEHITLQIEETDRFCAVECDHGVKTTVGQSDKQPTGQRHV
ncbi:MAG: cation diffusion facilitator family transporter [Rhodomicrobium sp.]